MNINDQVRNVLSFFAAKNDIFHFGWEHSSGELPTTLSPELPQKAKKYIYTVSTPQAGRESLYWLLGISVRKVDGFVLDCFIFLELWLFQMKGCKSITCICIFMQMPSVTQWGDGKEKSFFRHVKYMMTPGMRSLLVFV